MDSMFAVLVPSGYWVTYCIEKTAWMLNCKDDAKTACLI